MKLKQDKGIYCLIIKLSRSTKIKVGSLGKIDFLKGVYLYSGSAMNGLTNRINRHRKKQKKLFWHIDYLLNSRYAKIIFVIPIKTDKRLECILNRMVSQFPDATPVKGFGCSDCKCETHLFYFKEKDFKQTIKEIKL